MNNNKPFCKTIKKNPVARSLSNPRWKQKIIPNKKKYNRKKVSND